MFLSGMVGTASGGVEKKYKITNNRTGDGIVYPEYAAPGEYVRQTGVGTLPHITGSSGIKIPVGTVSESYFTGIATIAVGEKGEATFFVMPAEDVTIS